MEEVNPNPGQFDQEKKVQEVGPATGMFSDKELEYAVNKELRNDLNGFIAPQEAAMMNGMPAEKLMGLVINRKSIQVLINDRKESLRQSIRASMRRQSVRQSVAKLNKVQNTLQNKQQIDNLEQKAMELVNRPAAQSGIDLEEEARLRANMRNSIQ